VIFLSTQILEHIILKACRVSSSQDSNESKNKATLFAPLANLKTVTTSTLPPLLL
jgi:hypothetical protein